MSHLDLDATNVLFRAPLDDPDDVRFSVELRPGRVDLVSVRFLPEKEIRFRLASEYPSPERLDYFVGRALATRELFARVLRFYPDLLGECQLWVEDVPGGAGLAFCGNSTSHILIPDSNFMESRAYLGERTQVSRAWIPWEQRQHKVFWRGSSTGARSILNVTHWRDVPRFKLCLRAKAFGDNDLLDVALSNVVQVDSAEELDEIKQANIVAYPVPQWDFMKYKASIDIDGNSCSWPGLFTKLLMGICVIKVESQIGFRQWYYDRLQPWVNFIPLSSDMSDLLEIANWIFKNQSEARAIADRGRALAQSLTFERCIAEVAPLVRDYAIAYGAQRHEQFEL